MKRSVAIVGPTPMFVRWAIWHDCSLRELDAENLPDSTFRQLRGIREFSLARNEHRICEGFCIHPNSCSDDPTSALGFSSDEITEPYGGTEQVDGCCQGCPANTGGNGSQQLAGCYGWLPADSDYRIDRIARGNISDFQSQSSNALPATKNENDLVSMIDGIAQDPIIRQAIESNFQITNPVWYGLWRDRVLSSVQIKWLKQVFESAISIKDNQTADLGSPETVGDESKEPNDALARLVEALAVCAAHELPLHVELIPAGISDGQNWIIPAHCGRCKCPLEENPRQCSACGERGHQQFHRKQKLLGLRPYMHLHSILGQTQTVTLLKNFERDR